MSRINIDTAENLAAQFRIKNGLSLSEPPNAKTLLRILNIITLYRPLSDKLYGFSMKSADEKWRFMLINSNNTRGRQHFTIAHELYHLYCENTPHPHFSKDGFTAESEKSANLFAGALLMPKCGLLQAIPYEELSVGNISLATTIAMEALYQVSHSTLLIRLKELKLITKEQYENLFSVKIIQEAKMMGYDTNLYKNGNHGLILGDFGAKAKRLYDSEIISEGHYLELLNKIGYGAGENEDSAGC